MTKLAFSPCASRLAGLALAAGAVPSAWAEAPPWYEHQTNNAWIQNYDPTLVSRRLKGEFSFEQDDGNASTTEFSWSVRGAIPLHENLALGFQAGFPVKSFDDGGGSTTGLGDLDLRVGLVGRLSPTLRMGTGIISKYDTASDDSLGDGVFQIRPTFALRWDVREHINIGFNLEYTMTPQHESSGHLSYLEIPIPISVKLNHHWSTSLTYKPRFNFKTDESRHRISLDATRNWGAHNEYAWSFGTELPLSDQGLQWKLITGFSWSF